MPKMETLYVLPMLANMNGKLFILMDHVKLIPIILQEQQTMVTELNVTTVNVDQTTKLSVSTAQPSQELKDIMPIVHQTDV